MRQQVLRYASELAKHMLRYHTKTRCSFLLADASQVLGLLFLSRGERRDQLDVLADRVEIPLRLLFKSCLSASFALHRFRTSCLFCFAEYMLHVRLMDPAPLASWS